MTVTWIDPPGVRIARNEPIDFTATTDVVVIAVKFGSDLSVRECAYQEGVFLYPYLGSSVVGNTYTLVRTGGWPKTANVYVTEVASGEASAWETLYEKDLRTLPNQAVQVSPTTDYLNFTADGQPWCFHGVDSSLNIVNGQGMVMGTTTTYDGGSNYSGTFVCLRVHAMTGYDPSKCTAVQVRFSGLYGGRFGATHWSGAETWGNGPGFNHFTVVLREDSKVDCRAWTIPTQTPTSDVNTFVFAVSCEPYLDNEGSTWGVNSRTAHYRNNWTLPELPTMEQLMPALTYRAEINEQANFKMGFYLGDVTTGTTTLTATHVRVLQKPVTT